MQNMRVRFEKKAHRQCGRQESPKEQSQFEIKPYAC